MFANCKFHVLCNGDFSQIQEFVDLKTQFFFILLCLPLLRHTLYRSCFFVSISELAKLAQLSSDSPPLQPCSAYLGSSCMYEFRQLVIFEIVLSQ